MPRPGEVIETVDIFNYSTVSSISSPNASMRHAATQDSVVIDFIKPVCFAAPAAPDSPGVPSGPHDIYPPRCIYQPELPSTMTLYDREDQMHIFTLKRFRDRSGRCSFEYKSPLGTGYIRKFVHETGVSENVTYLEWDKFESRDRQEGFGYFTSSEVSRVLRQFFEENEYLFILDVAEDHQKKMRATAYIFKETFVDNNSGPFSGN